MSKTVEAVVADLLRGEEAAGHPLTNEQRLWLANHNVEQNRINLEVAKRELRKQAPKSRFNHSIAKTLADAGPVGT